MKLSFSKIGIPLLLLIIISCEKPATKDPCKELDAVDKKMLDMVEQIKGEYKSDRVFLTYFKNSQIYWTQYRNRQVQAIFPPDSPRRKYEYDTGPCKCEVYRDLTEIRIKELQKWLDGVPKDTNCRGSYKIKE